MDPSEWERFAGFFADRGLIGDRPERRRGAHQRAAAGPRPGLRVQIRRSRSGDAAQRRRSGRQRRASGRARSCRRGRGTARRGRSTPRPPRRRAAAEAGEDADELDVGEVAGGQRVGVAAAVEPEHCRVQGPIPRIRAGAGRRPASAGSTRPAATSRAQRISAIARAGARSQAASSAGATAGDHARRRGRRAAGRGRARPPSSAGSSAGRPSAARSGAGSRPRGAPRSAAR